MALVSDNHANTPNNKWLKFCLRRVVFKVNLPDFRRFAVIGLAAERNVALGKAGVCGEEVIQVP